MNARVIRRFVVLTAIALSVLVFVSAAIQETVEAPPGDYETRKGDLLLTDGEWDEAIFWFDKALARSPQHRGAMMGRAIALLQSGRTAAAEDAFTRLAAFLQDHLQPDDATGRAVLAGAYANRGILYDRAGRQADALADYRRALAIDDAAVDGPGLSHRILYGNSRPATVAARAAYLERQLALPEGERRLLLPERDKQQRMYKP